MLPPAMIVQSSSNTKQPKRVRIKLINGVNTFLSPNTSMANSDIMSRWIRIVMDMQQERDKKNILIMDSFRGHLTQEIGEACIATNSLRAVIPGELTSTLQPLDLTVNRSIKCKIKNYVHRQNILSIYNRDHNRSEMLKELHIS